MNVDFQDILRDMASLMNGPNPPSLLYALWAAILSSQKPLEMNCAQAAVLRPYVRSGLPTHDADELAHHINDNSGIPGWVYKQHAQAIIDIDGMYRAGMLRHLETEPADMRAWVRWRHEVAHLPCLGWKTSSFAALIMWPFSCPFVPVDSHVCDRLGHMADYRAGKLSKKSRAGYKRYRAVEREVYREMRALGITSMISAHHWYTWVVTVIQSGAERSVSHADLCPRF